MKCRAVLFLKLCPFCTWLTLFLSPFSSAAFFFPRCSPVCVIRPVRYSWCLLCTSRQASQMASLKVLTDAQCLLIKKLLRLTMTTMTANTYMCTLKPTPTHCSKKKTTGGHWKAEKKIKGKENDRNISGKIRFPTEDKIKKFICALYLCMLSG